MAAITIFFGSLVARYGVLGLAIGMFAESLGIPTASVVLELTAGPMILAGKTTYVEAVIFATLGLTAGSVVSYYLGYFGVDLGHYLFRRRVVPAPEGQNSALALVRRHGDIGIVLAQLFGPARTWISVPAGAMKMNIRKFTIYTAIGGSLYCAFAIGVSVALTGTLKALYLKLLEKMNSPWIAGLVVALVILSVVGSAYVGLRLMRRQPDKGMT